MTVRPDEDTEREVTGGGCYLERPQRWKWDGFTQRSKPNMSRAPLAGGGPGLTVGASGCYDLDGT